MIREGLRQIITDAIQRTPKLAKQHAKKLDFTVERPRVKKFGDWSTNIALIAAPLLRKSPMEIAENIKPNIKYKYLEDVQVAKPGFINLYFKNEWYYEVLKRIEQSGAKYGEIDFGKGKKVLLEYVSANPVGPLHLGHGRWATVGDTLASSLRKAGFSVGTEFYINNYGRQMKLFYQSVEAAYRKLFGESAEPPEDGYKGTYISKIAKDAKSHLRLEYSKNLKLPLREFAYNAMMQKIGDTLGEMDVKFDRYFKEREELQESGEVDRVIEFLKKSSKRDKRAKVYEEKGATWLNTSAYGDQKDRVLIRSNGEKTYFAADVAYHKNKLSRKFDKLINIWGADHHGYIARVKAAIAALGDNPDKLTVILGQLVNLYKDGKPVRMSKRTGELVTLDELLDDVGVDAARFTFLTKSTDSPLDFDIDLVKEQSDKNPVYYVQYAHARISSILGFAESKGISYAGIKNANLNLLKEETEIELIKILEEFEEIVENIAKNYTPHLLTTYAQKLATGFHSFYTTSRVIQENKPDLTQARLALLNAARITLQNVLKLLGVSAPEKM